MLLAVVAMAWTMHALEFQTSTARLLPASARYAALYRQYLQDFGELNDIVVAVDSDNGEESRRFVGRLAEALAARPDRFSRITYRLDRGFFERHGLLYLPLDTLASLRDALFDHEEFAEAYAAHPSLDRLLEGINQEVGRAFVSRFISFGLDDKPAPPNFAILDGLLTQMEARIQGTAAPYQSPWGDFFNAPRPGRGGDGYFAAPDGRLLFIFVEQTRREGSFTDNQEKIAELRAVIARLRAEFPGVRVGVTGSPALSNDEMTTAFRDSGRATALAVTVVTGLLLLFFREIRRPLLMLATLGLGLLCALGVITLTIGQLTVFSVMFISLMVGIGIDYGIYFLFRYEEERARGREVGAALERTAERAGPGILLGALTAAGTFAVLGLTEFRGIREFGIVSAIAILVAFLAMLTVFPALLALTDRGRAWVPRGAADPRARLDAPALEWIARHRIPVLGLAAVLTVTALVVIPRVRFDYNLLNLQAKGTESVEWERRILRQAGRSGFTGLATARTLDELRVKQAAFAALSSVSRVESVLPMVPEQQDAKRAILRQMAPEVADIQVAPPAPLDPQRLRTAVDALRRRLGLAVTESRGNPAAAPLVAVHSRLGVLSGWLARATPATIRTTLHPLGEALARDFAATMQTFRDRLDPGPITPESLPEGLRQRHVGRSGQFLIRIHPAVNIWEREAAYRFTTELRSVDPDVTGSPIITFEAIRLIERAYVEGTLYALLLVATVTLLVLRRVRESLLALTPLVLGTIWTLGLMIPLGLKFNLANVWGLPLIMGVAAEYGVNVMVRHMEAAADGSGTTLPRSTALAVFLNGLALMTGFGALLVARHQGIWSLGLLLTLGALAGLVAALAVLPALLAVRSRRAEMTATPTLSR
jgi:hopanoid biosynthesis associated RND transporter like protein HpnN